MENIKGLSGVGGDYKSIAKRSFKQSFHVNVLNNGEIWIDMLEKRKLLAHTYDQENFNLALHYIKKSYFPEINHLYEFFRKRK